MYDEVQKYITPLFPKAYIMASFGNITYWSSTVTFEIYGFCKKHRNFI